MKTLKEVEEGIKVCLQDMQSFLEEDEGGIEFVRFEEESGVAELRFTGNCAKCPLSKMTLRAGIERWLINKVPEIKRVESVV